MKKVFRIAGFVLLTLTAIVILLLLISYGNHQIKSKEEEQWITPMGTPVEVNGHDINVFSQGTGEKTLVFLSGGGTCSPILDFKSLYSLLADQYRIVVIEKAGYGFSEDSDFSRDLDTLLEEDRQALSGAKITGPFVLVPHSMSGLEALYWAQQYPKEVEAIVGLDMAVPAAYKTMELNLSYLQLTSLASKLGITRFLPEVADGEAVKFGTLTEDEKNLYRAIFYRRTATVAMLNECAAVKSNAALVEAGPLVDTPMHLFASDGSGGTGYDKETWRGFQQDFISKSKNATLSLLDSPHYVHNHEYERISVEIQRFLQSIEED